MATPSGRAAYKKKDGVLAVSPDQNFITWTPWPATGAPTVSLSLANVANLQQTPDTAPKVMLKIIEKHPNATDQASYLFHFTSPDARAEANSIKEVLSRLLQEIRANDPNVPKPTSSAASASGTGTPNAAVNGGSASASMAFAGSVNSKPAMARWFDDDQLRSDIELQQSLLKSDRSLNQTYMDARATKPESISDAAFNSQFWSTRINLLRAHAIETHQRKGAYNVLSTIKPRTEGEELKLSISVEQVQLIFNQHPLVKRLYNENVPKISEAEFWSRFFLSKLSRTLRGDKVQDEKKEGIVRDPLFDNHDQSENTQEFQSGFMARSVPHIIDVEANEENEGGFRSGNRKDVEMRPRKNILIVKTLNTLSEKIMANVAPVDGDREADGPDGADDSTINELMLRDLRGDAEEQRIILNVKEQNRFFSKQEEKQSANVQIFATQVPADVIASVRRDAELLEADETGGLDLHASLGIDEESDSDEGEGTLKTPHVGSRAARRAAEEDIMTGVKRRRMEKYGSGSDASRLMGLSQDIAGRCQLTHATTVEFLHQFWTAFLSGNPDRAAELQYLVESLKRSEARIDAVAAEAEKARDAFIETKRQEAKAYFDKTGVRDKRWLAKNVDKHVRGGRKAVMQMMQPILDSLSKAQADYQKALAAEGIQLSTES
ncbi:RNA polymerase II transcription factor B subunit 1 [Sodiomyces alkalinus F11]|uniref:RNA polymerase II transcription factor B subunit 1 n=1 Tax=Sodiomyces alkalinus (strain CBS 110278 / VKM F-3762 / F11) TaxID=1314773 RepID=A0A3N2PKM5_SODAK|nr:RNA polymerase II transcription factor B subunit 1 [Sodiomyces alkalinus F11]ROT34964.1 RNA polymerase II transcription factor B subunit 1 [Sodiomyces alkalinus F11]